MPKNSPFQQSVNAANKNDDVEASVVLNISVTMTNWQRLNRMKKSKGQKKEQDLVRVFISEGLDRAGF